MSPRYLLLCASLVLIACGSEGPLTLRSRGQEGGADTMGGAAGESSITGGSGGSIYTGGSGGSAGIGGFGGFGAGNGGISGSSGQSGAPGEAGAGGAPIRTVSQRSPFGDVAASDNLLWDGDFEWSGAFISQYSWSSGKTWSIAGDPGIAVYAECRSGMKCAKVKKNAALGGIGVSPRTAMTKVRGWARVNEGSVCSKVNVYLSSCFEKMSLENPAKATADEPDAEGWCQYEDDLPTLKSTPCMFIVNKTKGDIFVDAMYLGPGSSVPSISHPIPSKLIVEDAETKLVIESIREDFLKHRRGETRPVQRPSMHFPRVRHTPR